MNTRNLKLLAALVLAVTSAGAVAQSRIDLQQTGNPTLQIPLDPSQPVTISPLDGVINATADASFSCSTGGTCADVRVSLDAVDGGFFRVNGSSSATVPTTGSVTFSWNAPGGWTCQGTGFTGTTWAGTGKAPSDTEPVSAGGLQPGQYTAGLTCSNGPVSDTAANVSITVEQSGLVIPQQCQGRQPASADVAAACETNGFQNGSIVVNPNVNCLSYASLFRGPFPGDTGSGADFFNFANKYTALEFNTTGLTFAKGRWARVTPQIAPTFTGNKIMTISQCPGDFDQTKITQEMGDSDCYVKTQFGVKESVEWHRAGTADPGGSCVLQPGQTYWLNIFYTNDPAGTAPSQLQWACGTEGASAIACADNLAPSAVQ